QQSLANVKPALHRHDTSTFAM
ncbi:putative HTH-type transcriptional regulator YbaQ, partial [Haemophilus influenzae]